MKCIFSKCIIGLLATLVVNSVEGVQTYTQKVGGITWTYRIVDGDAWVGAGSYMSSGAVPMSTSGSITIPSVLGGKQVRGISSYAFSDCENIMSVTLPNSITNIGWYAFERCKSLSSITIPSSVRSIGYGAFDSCKSLISVVIPDGVMDIMGFTFYNCKSLADVTMPNGVTNMELLQIVDERGCAAPFVYNRSSSS